MNEIFQILSNPLNKNEQRAWYHLKKKLEAISKIVLKNERKQCCLKVLGRNEREIFFKLDQLISKINRS